MKILKMTLWLTGLPCSGKTTLAKRLKEELDKRGYITVHLDGDDVRRGLSADLGFSREDKKENHRRVAHVARLFNENGIVVIASIILPTNDSREMIKKIIGNLKMIYVKCDVGECEKRDTKGMYKRARLGEIPDFIGVSAPFEEPQNNADIVVDTQKNDIEECVKKILDELNIGKQRTSLKK